MSTVKESQIKSHLNKVINSKAFANTTTLRNLLNYLIAASLKGEAPKEMQIAYELFGEKAIEGKEKNVRTYISNLRKKLNEYYDDEGTGDVLQISIPKGNYILEFKWDRKVIIRNYIYKSAPAMLALSVVILGISLALLFSKSTPEQAKYHPWKTFYDTKYPTLIILGDHYFFQLRVGSKSVIARRHRINSKKDLDAFIEEGHFADMDIKRVDYAYLNRQTSYAMFKTLQNIVHSNNEFELNFNSLTSWEDVKNKNVIYISSFKTQSFLTLLHKEIGLEYDTKSLKLNYHINDSVIEYKQQSVNDKHTDYAAMVCFKTKDGRNYISFQCEQDIGNKALLKYLSKPENLEELEEKLEALDTDNYKVIFEVKGFGVTDFVIKPVRVDPILVDIDELWP